MAAPRPQSVVIECPHCATRYQVTPELLGPRGRKVACAHCGEAWTAEAPPPFEDLGEETDLIFESGEEQALDEEFSAAERAALAQVPAGIRKLLGPDEVPPPEVVRSIVELREAVQEAGMPAEPRQTSTRTQLAFKQRQLVLARELPMQKARRKLRIGTVAALCLIVGGGIAFRSEIVRMAPDLAGVYRLIGLDVNLVGLDFSEVTTLLSRRNGQPELVVQGTIRSVDGETRYVPPVVVTLLDGQGLPIYQWSVTPELQELRPGERLAFSTRLGQPPEAARRARLSFADGRGTGENRSAPKGAERDIVQ